MRGMRHLGSLLAGLIAAPAIWLLLAIGQPQATATIHGWLTRDEFDSTRLLGPIAYLAVAGLIAGLVACLRTSPAGATVAGLGFAGLYCALYVTPLRFLDAIPERLSLGPVHASPRVPLVNGTLATLCVLLLVAVGSFGRWRRWPRQHFEPPAASPAAEPDLVATGPSLTPAFSDHEVDTPPPAWPQPAEEAKTPTPTDAPAEPEPPTIEASAGHVPVSPTGQARPTTLVD